MRLGARAFLFSCKPIVIQETTRSEGGGQHVVEYAAGYIFGTRDIEFSAPVERLL